jgi:hypothetical protein
VARPSDPAIRADILAACTRVAMAGSLNDLSLIYPFGSAEALQCRIYRI